MSGFGTFICPKTGEEGCNCLQNTYPPVFGSDKNLTQYLELFRNTDKIVFGEQYGADPNNASVDTPGFLALKYARPT